MPRGLTLAEKLMISSFLYDKLPLFFPNHFHENGPYGLTYTPSFLKLFRCTAIICSVYYIYSKAVSAFSQEIKGQVETLKKRVEELVHGCFTCEAPKLITSVSEFQLQMPEGKKYKGSVSLGAEDGSKIKGLAATDSHRILLANDKIAGNTCDLVFGIDTAGLHAGDMVKGSILISSNLAEKKIPVCAVIEEEKVDSSEGRRSMVKRNFLLST